MTLAVEPEKILRDLRDLWVQLGHDQEAAGGVLRACAMTLLVTAEDDNDAEQVRHTMGVLMHDHPCRAIVLKIGQGAKVDARVFSECWMPYGGNQQICAEGVEVSASATLLTDVTRLLVPLIVADLPVVLWCRGSRAFSAGAFDPLFPLAEKIVLDSGAAPEPESAIRALRALRKQGFRIADLAWTRLTGWREVVAQAFYESNPSISSVRITHGGVASTSVRYFAKWIQNAIKSAAITLESEAGEPGLHSVALSSEIVVKHAGASSSDAALMREELSILGADPVFDRVLA